MKHLLPLLLLPAAVAVAQPPAKPSAFPDLNKLAVEVLRVQHDRGADLYNAGDAAGAVKVYETALGTVSPFLAHHPAIQKAIADGMLDARKADGEKVRAFKLHELIEQVRADLRTETKKLEDEAKKPTPVAPPVKPKDPPMPKPKDPPVKPKNPPVPPKAALSGVVTLKGKPLPEGEVVVVSMNVPAPRVSVAKIENGTYTFPVLPPGEYVVVLQGALVPAKYQTTDTSGLRATVAVSGNTLDLKLE